MKNLNPLYEVKMPKGANREIINSFKRGRVKEILKGQRKEKGFNYMLQKGRAIATANNAPKVAATLT